MVEYPQHNLIEMSAYKNAKGVLGTRGVFRFRAPTCSCFVRLGGLQAYLGPLQEPLQVMITFNENGLKARHPVAMITSQVITLTTPSSREGWLI